MSRTFAPARARFRRHLAAAAGCLGVVLLAACSPSAPPATGTEVVPFDERDPEQFTVGDCFSGADLEALDFEPDERVTCDTSHNLEVVGLLTDFDGEPLPGTDEIDETFFPPCIEQITERVIGAVDELPVAASYTGDLAADGVSIDGPVLCIVYTRNGDLLTGSVLVTDAHELIGEFRLIKRLDPGTCFTLDAQNNLGLPAPCAAGTLKYLGAVESAFAEYPGEDALKAERDERCAELLPPDDDQIDPATLLGTIPVSPDWYRGDTTITCDVEVI